MSGRPDFEPITSSDGAPKAELAEPGVPHTPHTPQASPTEPGTASEATASQVHGTAATKAGEAAVTAGSADSREGLQPEATAEAASETQAPARRKRPVVADDHVPTPRDKLHKVGVMLPPETWRALRQRGTDRRCSLNFLILQALKRDNLPVKTADLIDDGRRQNARSKRR